MAHIYLRTGLTRRKTAKDAPAGDLKILILNLMPNRAVTERQFVRILQLAGSPATDIEVTFCLPATHAIRRHAEQITAAYTNFAAVQNENFDALIVTGAPLDRIAFTDVDYWDEFQQILRWRHTHVRQSLFLCWGADAAGYADGVFTPEQLDRKITGVYTANGVTMPQSRYFKIPLSVQRGEVLAGNSDLGALIVADASTRSHYVAGHFEYLPGTLADEYHRDRRKNGALAPRPANYFDPDMRPQYTWRSSATAFYHNWLAQLA
ncbi:homoserine O-acetyltransferase/O-succinyltransferase family protein [Lacticaseibacillus hulanensis]|uniref:homoserine O-acetyltransferase/O-succinyltransferase family protein n=1 Tax=Lacticaseibacillus hulanensis TaxID=2493111 RepID=UPI000FDC085C|nr:homoserine O-succinyltransferase [Lacticaseibacillus hulanensis]